MNAPAPKHSSALLMAWRLAELEAATQKVPVLEPEHFFLGLLKLPEIGVSEILSGQSTLSDREIRREAGWTDRLDRCFREAGLDATRTRRRLRHQLVLGEEETPPRQRLRRSPPAREVFEDADAIATGHGSVVLEPLHLLAALLGIERPQIRRVLELQGCPADMLARHVETFLAESGSPEDSRSLFLLDRDRELPAAKGGKKNVDQSATFGRDLTALARNRKLPQVIGREAEMRSLVQILLRSRKNNAILIGEPGVGKTCVVEGLAQRIADRGITDDFAGKRIIELSMGALLAGTGFRGDLEARLQSLVAEATGDPDLILFVDEIHLLVGAGKASGSPVDAANLLKPALSRGEIRVIGATTTREYRRMMEADPALVRRFEVVEVGEPGITETLGILRGIRADMESHHRVRIDDGALGAAVNLTVRHLPSLRLPDKAIDMLDQACAQARMLTLSSNLKEIATGGLIVTAGHVAAAVAHRCKVPVGDVGQDQSDLLLDLEKRLSERVIGQPEAIRSVSEMIRVAKSGLKGSESPLASFLFAGPSGVGKTELAKALAVTFFGDERHLVRMDMSEFMEAHSVSKMIGAPPGFVGHEQGGQLTEQVRTKPSCVVLLDEVEKAHPRILDLFLQVLDTGFLTDSHGIKADFRNAIIVMTSNIGATGTGHRKIGFTNEPEVHAGQAAAIPELGPELERFFRREFLNRLSAVLPFGTLDHSAISQILALQIRRLNENLASRGVSLEVSPEAGKVLIDEASGNSKGARRVAVVIQEHVTSPLSKLLLANLDPSGSYQLDAAPGTKALLLVKRADQPGLLPISQNNPGMNHEPTGP